MAGLLSRETRAATQNLTPLHFRLTFCMAKTAGSSLGDRAGGIQRWEAGSFSTDSFQLRSRGRRLFHGICGRHGTGWLGGSCRTSSSLSCSPLSQSADTTGNCSSGRPSLAICGWWQAPCGWHRQSESTLTARQTSRFGGEKYVMPLRTVSVSIEFSAPGKFTRMRCNHGSSPVRSRQCSTFRRCAFCTLALTFGFSHQSPHPLSPAYIVHPETKHDGNHLANLSVQVRFRGLHHRLPFHQILRSLLYPADVLPLRSRLHLCRNTRIRLRAVEPSRFRLHFLLWHRSQFLGSSSPAVADQGRGHMHCTNHHPHLISSRALPLNPKQSSAPDFFPRQDDGAGSDKRFCPSHHRRREQYADFLATAEFTGYC